jgi:hypothetical protein
MKIAENSGFSPIKSVEKMFLQDVCEAWRNLKKYVT